MKALKALFFDMDGTIVDTERDGHRVAFNQAFASCGINAEWDVSTYHRLLQVAGGKERMKTYFQENETNLIDDGINLDELVQQLHLVKTELFVSLIENGQLPLRPGIRRLMQEANANGILVGICTTSNEKAVKAIVGSLLSDVKIDLILAGDVVKRKKPDPEIYKLALQKTGFAPDEVLVVEDSENGVISAKEAGIKVLVTVNEYTRDENLSRADLVLTSLGDSDHPLTLISGSLNPNTSEIHLNDLISLIN